jgi:hypothetical protein
MGASAPDSVKLPVDLFDRERRVYQSPDYEEEQLSLLTKQSALSRPDLTV